MAKEVKPPTTSAEQRTNQTTSHTADEKPHTEDNQEINTGNVAQKSGSAAGSPSVANEQAEKAAKELDAKNTEVKRGANPAGEDDVKPAQVENEPEEVKRGLPARLRRRLSRKTNNPNMSERHAKDPAPAPPGPVPTSTARPAEPAVAAKPVGYNNCGHCSGTGLNPDDYGKLCAWCKGKGKIPKRKN